MLKSAFCCKCCLKPRQTKYLCINLRKCRLQGLRPQASTGELPLDSAGDFCPSDPVITHHWKKILWAPMQIRKRVRQDCCITLVCPLKVHLKISNTLSKSEIFNFVSICDIKSIILI